MAANACVAVRGWGVEVVEISGLGVEILMTSGQFVVKCDIKRR